MKAIEKANKKAYQEIRNISNAKNMLDVISSMNEVLLKTFGLWSLGLQKIRMNNDELFESLKSRRLQNMEKHGKEVKAYLITFIPERLRNTIMYNELINS